MDPEDPDTDAHQKKKSAHFPISDATITFQGLMICSALYMSMLCTNWGSLSIFDNTTDFFVGSDSSYKLKIFAEWATIGIYIFSLVAPLLCPNRNFE